MTLTTYIKIQKTLLALCLISAVVFVLSLPIVNGGFIGNATPANNTIANNASKTTTNGANNSANAPVNLPANQPEAQNGGYGLMIIGGVSFLTSLCSLLGFVSTTVLAWRKEKRDVETIRVDNEKKELELAKLKFELEKILEENKAPKRKPAARPRKKTGE